MTDLDAGKGKLMIVFGIIALIIGILCILLGVLMLLGQSIYLFFLFASIGALIILLSNGARGRTSGKGKWIIILAVILVAVFLITSAKDSLPSKPTRVGSGDINAGSSAATASEESYGPGDTVELDGVRITFHGLNETMGNELWHPDTNKVYAIAEFTVDNGTDKQIDISSIFGSEAYCDGYLVHEDFGAELGDRQGRENLTGSIAAGRKMRGIIGYELPQQWQELEIKIQSDWWKGRSSAITFVAIAN